MIKQYLRNSNNTPIGVMLADLRDGNLVFGWSVTNPADRYNRKLGDLIAANRLNADTPNQDIVVPTVMFFHMDEFILRAQKYFRTATEKYLIDGYIKSINSRYGGKDPFDSLPEPPPGHCELDGSNYYNDTDE